MVNVVVKNKLGIVKDSREKKNDENGYAEEKNTTKKEQAIVKPKDNKKSKPRVVSKKGSRNE